jgi:hypothetical protein
MPTRMTVPRLGWRRDGRSFNRLLGSSDRRARVCRSRRFCLIDLELVVIVFVTGRGDVECVEGVD